MKVEYELMTPHEVTAARERASVAFVPIGPLEWHGPHLPLGTDGLHAHAVACAVARRIGGVVLPTLFAGTDSLRPVGDEPQGLAPLGLEPDRVVGMDFPGNAVRSTYLHETVFGALVREVIHALKGDRWRLVVLLNGHGATNHQRTLRRLAAEETEPGGAAVRYEHAWVPKEPPASDPGHAERFETSILMALAGEHVRLDLLPPRERPLVYGDYGIVEGDAFDGRPNDGFTVPSEHDPRNSSDVEGQETLRREVERLCQALAPTEEIA